MLSTLKRINRRCRIEFRIDRDSGSVTISVLAIMIILFALAAGVTQLSTVTARASENSTQNLRLFYLADSGVQIGNAMVHAAGGLPATTAFEESIGGGTISIVIQNQGTNGIKVTSTGTLYGQQQTIELVIKITTQYSPRGATELIVDPGVEVDDHAGWLPVGILGTSKISGQDHAADGTLLADQTGATVGLALTPLPGNVDWVVTKAAGATLEGVPDVSTNQATDQSDIINNLRSYVQGNADVTVYGSTTLGDAHTGSYGTALAPALVYVDLDEEETLTLSQGFTGYGTLFIDIWESEDVPTLVLQDAASWHGPIVIRFREECEVDGQSLVVLRDSAKIIGALTLHFSGEEIEIDGAGDVLNLSGSAQILFSSETTSNARGFNNISNLSFEVVAYQTL